jgi:hypothetical protein
MTLTESKKGFTFTGPGNYRIRVQGFLDEHRFSCQIKAPKT